MNKLLTVIFSAFTLTVSGQVDPTIWDSLKTISTDYYEIKVPHKWRPMRTGDQGPEQYFEASGLALPAASNGSPVIVTVFLAKQESKNLDDCKDRCLKGYRSNPDREFPEMFEDGVEKIKLNNGQHAYILNTRFYRKSKEMNQSRFDLVVYSEKANTGYFYTLSIQYSDSTYKFEDDNKLADFARKLYSYVTIKN